VPADSLISKGAGDPATSKGDKGTTGASPQRVPTTWITEEYDDGMKLGSRRIYTLRCLAKLKR
jgi:hypothetical protein